MEAFDLWVKESDRLGNRVHCETNTNEEDKGGIESTVFPISNDKR